MNYNRFTSVTSVPSNHEYEGSSSSSLLSLLMEDDVVINEEFSNWDKFLKNRLCSEDAPGVIDDQLLNEVLKGELKEDDAEYNKLVIEGGSFDFDRVTEIRIEFKKILRIDHLWVLKNLRVLKLCNNCIEKIENLDALENLIDLDLSFNKISKIENLRSLEKLEKLSLYDNLIKTIENIEKLVNLQIFSIGRNKIRSWNNIIYLRCLPKLKSLNMAENPCASVVNFKYFLAIFLPNLVYYEYRLITKIERQLGDELYHSEYELLVESEEAENGRRVIKQKEEEEAQTYADSFVEYLNTRRLFDSFWENDKEGCALLLMGGDAKNLYNSYEEIILQICKDIFNMGQEQYRIRQTEMDSFRKATAITFEKSQQEAIKHMEDFLNYKDGLIDKVMKAKKFCTVMPAANFMHYIAKKKRQFQHKKHATWKVLMKLETRLNEEICEQNENYERSLIDLIENFTTKAHEMFSYMRDAITEYQDKIQEVANAYYATVVYDVQEMESHEKSDEKLPPKETVVKFEDSIMSEGSTTASAHASMFSIELPEVDEKGAMVLKKLQELFQPKIPLDLRPYVTDRDTLMSTLATSKDNHLMMVDNRQDLLISRTEKWLKDSVKILSRNEIARNREKVKEINRYLRIHEEDFNSILDRFTQYIHDLALLEVAEKKAGKAVVKKNFGFFNV